MNRSDETLFDPRIAIWLEDDPNAAPDQALGVVLAAFPSIKQRRTRRVPWRVPDMSPLSKFVALAAAVAVVVVGAYLLLPRFDNSIGAPPTASPSPSPAATSSPTSSVLNTSAWVEYASDRYGFSIAHPSDWREEPALGDWTIENDAEAWVSNATESFVNPQGSVKVSAWSIPLGSGSSLEGWMTEWCMATSPQPATCSALADRAFAVETKDGHPGLGLVVPDKDPASYFLDGETIYVVAVWRGETDPEVQPYGGARALLEAYVSTLTLPPATPTLSSTPTPLPVTWDTYESDRYGFTIGYPSGWEVRSAQREWTLEDDANDWLSSAQEAFIGPNIRVSAWTFPVDPVTGRDRTLTEIEGLVEQYCMATDNADCSGIADRAVPLCHEARDCHPGILVPFENEVQAFIAGGNYGNEIVVVTVWWGENEPAVAQYGGSQRILEAFLSTMGVWPSSVPFEERVEREVPTPSQS